MKKLQILLLGASLVGLTVLTGCPGTEPVPEPSFGENQAAALAGAWTATEVTFSGTSRIDTWGTNFTLTFSGAAEGSDMIWGGNYSTSGHSADEPDATTVWPSNGSWEFLGENSVGGFYRNGNRGMNDTFVVSVTATTLDIQFTLTDPSGGRSEQIFGDTWSFSFTKN